MPSSKTLTDVANWALPILKMQPLSVTNMEPAVTCANIVLQTVFAPPMKWRFNRGTFSFPTVAYAPGTPPTAQFDYPQELSDFSYLEDQWVVDPKGNVFPLTGALSLHRPTGTAADPQRPTHVSAQFDDNAGNITFRLKQVPDQIYQIEGEYQRKVLPILSPASQFAPFPDEFMHVVDWMFLTLTSLLINDSRFPRFEQYAISRLLSLQGGLDEVSRSIFIGDWNALTSTLQRNQALTQQSIASRGV